MRGDIRCVDGDLWRHVPEHDDPECEVYAGRCKECDGIGCDEIERRAASAKNVTDAGSAKA